MSRNRVLSLWIHGVSHHGAQVTLAMWDDHTAWVEGKRAQSSNNAGKPRPMTEGTIVFDRVSKVYGPILDRPGGTAPADLAPADWRPNGQIVQFEFQDGVATISTSTYGPGDTWTTGWQVHCAGVQVSTRSHLGRTATTLLGGLLQQWWFLLLVAFGAFLWLGKTLHWFTVTW